MNYRLNWRSAANRDVHEALAWYEVEAPHQVRRLLQHIEDAERVIRGRPHMQRLIDADHRRFALRTFPYEIWYRIVDDRELIQILAFKHDSRDGTPYERRLEPPVS